MMKQIPYGITDFSRIQKENYYYVDKTMFIEKIEMQPPYLFLIRPRRFGKSLTLAEFSQSTQVDSFPAYLNRYIKNDVLEVMANGSLNYTVKGICIGMKVTWNYTPPTNGGDTFTSIKKGSKIKIFIKI